MRALLLIAALTTACGQPAGAGSNKDAPMVSPAITPLDSLIGEWSLSAEEGSCRILLIADRHPRATAEAPDWRVARPGPNCPQPLARLTGWYPAPLGLVLTDDEGAAVLTFESIGAGTYAAHGGTSPVLRRPG